MVIQNLECEACLKIQSMSIGVSGACSGACNLGNFEIQFLEIEFKFASILAENSTSNYSCHHGYNNVSSLKQFD